MSEGLAPRTLHSFRAYGLSFSSEIRISHIPDASFAGGADVRIRLGEVFGPSYTPPPSIAVDSSPERLLIRGARSATILVSGGDSITVEPLPGGDPSVIRQLLLGWALGGIFHQRGLLPLHASALCNGQECYVLCAGSGTGKSTLAAAFLDRGFSYLDDNVALVRYRDGTPHVLPGTPELRLWADALPGLAFAHQVLGPIQAGSSKWSVSALESFRAEEAPIRKVFVLRRTVDRLLSFVDLGGAEKFRALMEHVFSLPTARDLASQGRLFRLVQELAAKVGVAEVRLPAEMPSPDALCGLILAREKDDNRSFRSGARDTRGG